MTLTTTIEKKNVINQPKKGKVAWINISFLLIDNNKKLKNVFNTYTS